MRRVFVLTGAIVFVDTLFFAALTPLLPHYVDRFELSKAGAGLLAACYPLGVLAGGIPGGIAATRAGVKPTALGALVLIAGASAVFGFGKTIWVLDAARFTQGVASAFAWTAALTWLIRVAPAARRGEMIGSALGVAIAGALFGPAAGALAAFAGTGPVFAAIAGLCVVGALLALRTPAPPVEEEPAPPRIRRMLRDRRIAGGLWLIALPALLFGTQSVLVPLHLHELGFGAAAIGAVYIVATALGAFAAPTVGRVSDRRGRRVPILVGLLGSAALSAALPWPERAWVLAPLSVVAVLFFGLSWAPAMSLVTHTAERRGADAAWAVALINIAWAPGQALGSLGGGGLARLTSDWVPFVILSGMCLATFVAVQRS
jgi:predicted MFS family arabinose efflux permease